MPSAPTDAATFTGFGPDLVAFYEGLAVDNTRAYWQAHKQVYDTQVRGPLEALAAALEPRFGAIKVFRPNQDVRFRADKRPYKDNASMAATTASGAAYYLAVSADALTVAGGLYSPAPDQLERFRRAVDAGPPATQLDEVVAGAAAAGLALSDGNPLTTAPRGWARDHPRIDLLRRRSLTLGATHPPAPWWHTAQLLDAVRAAWEACARLNDWCERHVGPSTAPARQP